MADRLVEEMQVKVSEAEQKEDFIVPVGNPGRQPAKAADRPGDVPGKQIDADAPCGQQTQERDTVSGEKLLSALIDIRQIPAHPQIDILRRDVGYRGREHVIMTALLTFMFVLFGIWMLSSDFSQLLNKEIGPMYSPPQMVS